jgi:hypothetical protein
LNNRPIGGDAREDASPLFDSLSLRIRPMKQDLQLNTEYPEPGEEQMIQEGIALLKSVIEQRYFNSLTYRDVHVKGHAAVRAEFVVEPGLPDDCRVGVFREPRSYSAWIRYSNSNQDQKADILGDIRGFAIKLMGVEGPKLLDADRDGHTQDFLFLSTNLFLTRNARDFFDFVKAGALNYQRSLSDYFRIFVFLIAHPTVGPLLLKAQRKFPNLFEIEWFSATPYLFGQRAVKYALKPWQKPASDLPRNPTNNFLRERLKEDLATHGAGFDFMVQYQLDPYREPIENSLVPWNTPFHKLASIRIPPQEIDSPELLHFTENLSFNPWRCLPEHRPLGSANRARKAVYLAISEFRRSRNGVPTTEPSA